MFTQGTIDGVLIRPMVKFVDDRGWLTELFRDDEIEPDFRPAMGYLSVTAVGVARGPHEHVEQADCFCFIGPSNFKIYLWDNRKSSPTFRHHHVFVAGEDAPTSVIIPPGVVHAYRNVGQREGLVVNLPNRLYAGRGKKEPVDEIRHESDAKSRFRLD